MINQPKIDYSKLGRGPQPSTLCHSFMNQM